MTNLKISLLALVPLLTVLSGCATISPMQPTIQTFDIPKISETRTVELGETTVEKGRVFTFDAIDLKNQVTGGDGFFVKKFTIPPGILLGNSETSKYRIFFSKEATMRDALIGTMPASGLAGLAISKSTSPVVMVFGNGIFLKPSEPPQFTMTKANAVGRPSFKQEFIYNGKAGDSVKFLYRELSDDFLRPAFSQELQYDLKESRIIGIKGLRLEILKASNTQLEYRVLSSFPDHHD